MASLPPNIIETYIKGYDGVKYKRPDVHFTTTITDHLTARVNCTPLTDPNCGCTTSSKTVKDTTDEIIAVITGVVAGVQGLIEGPIGTLLAYIGIDKNDLQNQPPGPSQGGAGCSLNQSLPVEIALPQTGGPPQVGGGGSRAADNPQHGRGAVWPPLQRNKLVIQYPGVPQVLDQAIVFIGTAGTAPRTPAVQIVGPSDVSISLHNSNTSASYTVVTVPPGSENFFGDLTITWSGDPNHVQIADAKSRADIIFRGDPDMQPGSHITQTITVRVTDVEGSSATASMNVIIKKPHRPPPVLIRPARDEVLVPDRWMGTSPSYPRRVSLVQRCKSDSAPARLFGILNSAKFVVLDPEIRLQDFERGQKSQYIELAACATEPDIPAASAVPVAIALVRKNLRLSARYTLAMLASL